MVHRATQNEPSIQNKVSEVRVALRNLDTAVTAWFHVLSKPESTTCHLNREAVAAKLSVLQKQRDRLKQLLADLTGQLQRVAAADVRLERGGALITFGRGRSLFHHAAVEWARFPFHTAFQQRRVRQCPPKRASATALKTGSFESDDGEF